ncbi:hypothetical protein ES705_27226 [subsurface metagenome]
MEIKKAIEILTDEYIYLRFRRNLDLRDAVKMGVDGLRLLSHGTTYCLDSDSLQLLRDTQRRKRAANP